jgi:glucokinase
MKKPTGAKIATLLAADIGGTKSELAIFPLQGADNRALVQRRYLNADYKAVEEIVARFLADCGYLPQHATIAVAGVVADGRAGMTNLPWVVDSRRLEQRFGLQCVLLINDLTAVAGSIPLLGPDDLLEIQAGAAACGEIRGVVAPGTGLGEGMLLAIGDRLFARGSEGGHTDFAPVDEEQLALLAWMRKKSTPVSYEMLIAGPGLASLYDFCKEYHDIPESPEIALAMARAKDRIPVIVDGAVGGRNCPLCRHVIELFLRILGSEAGNLALKLYARGGMYLGGGILPRLAGKVSFAGFLQAFNSKGLMADLMAAIPVSLILRADAALIGAASIGRTESHPAKNDDRNR